jgi:hypothetical protein
LNSDEKKQLAVFLSDHHLQPPRILQLKCSNKKFYPLLRHYKKIDDALSQQIYKDKHKWEKLAQKNMPNLPSEKRVEDAGLEEDADSLDVLDPSLVLA